MVDYRTPLSAGVRLVSELNFAMPSCDGYGGRYVLADGSFPDGFGGRPVVLVVDGSTDRKLLDTMLAQLAVAVQPASAAQWALVSAGRQDGSTVRSVLQTIEASVAAQPWGSQLGGGTAGSELRPA